MNKFFNENKKLFLIILSISIVIPIIILTPSPIGIIEYETGLTLIGYCGSILGGFLTLYGVWWTIKEQNKNLIKQQEKLDRQRREDLAIQYKPYLVLEKPVTFTNEEINNSYLHYNNIFDLNETLDLKNIGRGEAIISSIYVSNLEDKTNLIDIQTQIDSYYINKNSSAKLNITIKAINLEPIFNSKTDNEYILNIVYSDLLKFYKYTKSMGV